MKLHLLLFLLLFHNCVIVRNVCFAFRFSPRDRTAKDCARRQIDHNASLDPHFDLPAPTRVRLCLALPRSVLVIFLCQIVSFLLSFHHHHPYFLLFLLPQARPSPLFLPSHCSCSFSGFSLLRRSRALFAPPTLSSCLSTVSPSLYRLHFTQSLTPSPFSARCSLIFRNILNLIPASPDAAYCPIHVDLHTACQIFHVIFFRAARGAKIELFLFLFFSAASDFLATGAFCEML